MKKSFFILIISLSLVSCSSDEDTREFSENVITVTIEDSLKTYDIITSVRGNDEEPTYTITAVSDENNSIVFAIREGDIGDLHLYYFIITVNGVTFRPYDAGPTPLIESISRNSDGIIKGTFSGQLVEDDSWVSDGVYSNNLFVTDGKIDIYYY